MKAFGITNIGKVRSENQDSVIVREPDGGVIVVVCDGMGGERRGNVASELAASNFVGHITAGLAEEEPRALPQLVAEAAAYANVKVYDRAFTDLTCEGMGTTLVGGVFAPGSAHFVNVGDSRAYMISRGVIWQVTRDHSYVEELVQQGIITREAARTHPRRNYITRALGIAREVQCDAYELEPEEGNILLLCSDGLSNMVEPEEMLAAAQTESEPETLCRALLDLALTRAATDNITVAAIAF
jgi:protein phosphatase